MALENIQHNYGERITHLEFELEKSNTEKDSNKDKVINMNSKMAVLNLKVGNLEIDLANAQAEVANYVKQAELLDKANKDIYEKSISDNKNKRASSLNNTAKLEQLIVDH